METAQQGPIHRFTSLYDGVGIRPPLILAGLRLNVGFSEGSASEHTEQDISQPEPELILAEPFQTEPDP